MDQVVNPLIKQWQELWAYSSTETERAGYVPWAFLLNSMFPRTLFFVLGVSWTFILFDPPRQTEHDAYLREMWANETWANLE